jgi:hypothetical protein
MTWEEISFLRNQEPAHEEGKEQPLAVAVVDPSSTLATSSLSSQLAEISAK